jgi:hypothetical protein
MQTATQQTAQQYSESAKALLQELQAQAQKVLTQHPEIGVQAKPDADVADDTFSCSGSVIFTGLLVWERIRIDLSSTPALTTTTDIWGPTIAIGGESWGTMWSNIPFSQLAGLNLTIQVNIASVAVQISFWQGANLIATFVGGGVGIGTAVLGGSCQFGVGS